MSALSDFTNDDLIDPTTKGAVAVYKLYNDAEALLYVGITDNPQKRFASHAKDKRWWWEVCSWEIHWHASRAIALAMESAAIQDRYPAYNIVGAPTLPPQLAIAKKWGPGARRLFRPGQRRHRR